MLQTGVVKVSGRGTNVDFAIDDTLPFEQVVSGLREYLTDKRLLLSKGTITIDAGLRMGSREQLSELRRVIEQESGLTVSRFWCSPEAVDQAATSVLPRVQQQPSNPPLTERMAGPEDGPVAVKSLPKVTGPSEDFNALMLRPTQLSLAMGVSPSGKTKPRHATTPEFLVQEVETAEQSGEPDAPGLEPEILRLIDDAGVEPDAEMADIDKDPQDLAVPEADDADREPRRETALLVKSTCHSGEVIRHPGDVVILGDVNPGAEIIAAGDVTVFGALRGAAHAGSGGLTTAAIIAYRLESPRLQIGPYVGVASTSNRAKHKRDKSNRSDPMIAYVRRQSIYVATFTGRFAKYSRGILYEG